MYAVIRAGGKQHKVAKGDIIEVEKVKDGETLEFTPLLIVDDKGKVRSGQSDLSKALVTAKVVEETKGTKIEVYKYRNKSRYRRHAGHRQKLHEDRDLRDQALRREVIVQPRRKRRQQMAHKKGASSSRNGRDSESKRLGVKTFGGQSTSRPA